MTTNFEFESQASSLRPQKTKDDYSRNIKKLKYKLFAINDKIKTYEQKINSLQNTSNDKIISLKISKFCKERRFTPQMLFRFADIKCKGFVSRIQFKNCLTSIGLKLTQHQLTRLQYLLDQDISGQISFKEYNNYLYAFGIKKQFNPNDEFMQNALKLLDINKIKNIQKQTQNGKKNKKNRTLLNYEQFIKYCHKNFPEINDKQLASIFDKLSKNDLIDLQDLIDYLHNLQEEAKRLQEKNKKKQQKKKVKGQDLESEGEEQVIDINTLKGVIKAVLKFHPIEQTNFHCSQFLRLEKTYSKPKGSITCIFKRIDKKLNGSFSYVELINYFANSQKDKPDIKFVFQLMGKKIQSEKNTAESFLAGYSMNSDQISQPSFQKLSQMEYQINPQMAKYLFTLIERTEKNKPDHVFVQNLLKLMKLQSKHKVYIRPNFWQISASDFYNKHNETILTNPLAALKICISLTQQLKLLKQNKRFWSDYEFGSSNQDPDGFDSIGIKLPIEQVKWIRCSKLGMTDFYIPQSKKQDQIKQSRISPHNLFSNALNRLISMKSTKIFNNKNQINRTLTKIQQQDLNILFQGLYPAAFHSFAKFGIYVLRFYTRAKWVYVIVDDKIPCDKDNQVLFGVSFGQNCNYVSILQKAYAKLKGSYEKMFVVQNYFQYIHELSSFLPANLPLFSKQSQQKTKQSDLATDFKWKNIFFLMEKTLNTLKQQNTDKQMQGIYCYSKNILKEAYMQNLKGKVLKLKRLVELTDTTIKNYHRSHRLFFLELNNIQLNGQQKWNPNWSNKGDVNNKFHKFDEDIQQIFRKTKKQPIDLKDKYLLIINYKLVRSLFSNLIKFNKINFSQMIIMRKQLQFQKDHKCLYKIVSTSQEVVNCIILVQKLKAPNDAVISIKVQDSIYPFSDLIKSQFYCCPLVFDKKQGSLSLKLQNWKESQTFAYKLTLYFQNPKFKIQERDRHILFRFVSQYEQHIHLTVDSLKEKTKQFIYTNFYANAQRKTMGCC